MALHDWLYRWSEWAWPLVGNHLWQATLVTLMAAASAYCFRRGPARVRYGFWLLAAINLAAPAFAVSLIAAKLGLNPVHFIDTSAETASTVQVFYQVTAPIARAVEASHAGFEPPGGHGEVLCALAVVWSLGLLSLAGLWCRNRLRLARAFRSGREATSGREREALMRVRAWLRVKQEVRLVLSPRIAEPGVIGMWRPVIILPESISGQLDEQELESVFMHELVHVLRWDNLASNLQMLVCCAFWFHPLVWLIDRRMLAERERACDEKVIELGGRSQVYATSLLKVLRFCMGLKMAGLSSAAGSNLRRRVEEIMSSNERRSLSLSQRVLVGAIAVAVISVSLVAGVITANGALAQDEVRQGRTAPIGGITGGVAGGIAGGVPGGVPGGVEGGIPGGVAGGIAGLETSWSQDPALRARLEQAPEIALRFDDSNGAPLLISDARIKAVKLHDTRGLNDKYAVRPVVRLTNTTDRRVTAFALEFVDTKGEISLIFERVEQPIEAYGTYTSGQRSAGVLSLGGSPETWVVRVSGVMFENGGRWGDVPPPPPPPPPSRPSDREIEMLKQAPDTLIQINNEPDSPLIISQASVKAVPVDGAHDAYWIRPSLTLVNNTVRSIKMASLLLVSLGDRSYGNFWMGSVKIGPYESYTLSGDSNGAGSPYFSVRGRPDELVASIKGVVFDDNGVWGHIPPPPPPVIRRKMPEPPAGEPPQEAGPSGDGIIQKPRLIKAAPPQYTEQARRNRVSGTVTMDVLIDVDGTVKEAKVIEGLPDGLDEEAMRAASRMRFKPAMKNGTPIEYRTTVRVEFKLK